MQASRTPNRDIDFMSTALGEWGGQVAALNLDQRVELRNLLRNGLRAHVNLGEASPLNNQPELILQAESIHEELRRQGRSTRTSVSECMLAQ